jgi:hypothetical protein
MALQILEIHNLCLDLALLNGARELVGVYMRVRHGAIVVSELRGRRASLIRGSIEDPTISAERGIGDVGGVVEGWVEAVDVGGGKGAAREEQAEEEGEHFENTLIDRWYFHHITMGWGFYIRNVERQVELEVVDNCKGLERSAARRDWVVTTTWAVVSLITSSMHCIILHCRAMCWRLRFLLENGGGFLIYTYLASQK